MATSVHRMLPVKGVGKISRTRAFIGSLLSPTGTGKSHDENSVRRNRLSNREFSGGIDCSVHTGSPANTWGERVPYEAQFQEDGRRRGTVQTRFCRLSVLHLAAIGAISAAPVDSAVPSGDSIIAHMIQARSENRARLRPY